MWREMRSNHARSSLRKRHTTRFAIDQEHPASRPFVLIEGHRHEILDAQFLLRGTGHPWDSFQHLAVATVPAEADSAAFQRNSSKAKHPRSSSRKPSARVSGIFSGISRSLSPDFKRQMKMRSRSVSR